MARAIKVPSRPLSEQPETLTTDERELLAQCNAAVETLQWAFWLAGKALEAIRKGKLYRAEASSFEEYVWKHWNMKKAYANKLIRTWRIAEAVFELLSNEAAPIGAKTEEVLRSLNQAQVWELVPVSETWDVDAAVLVFRTLVEVDGVNVTAKVVKGAVEKLPASGEYDEAHVIKLIREYAESLTDEDEEEDESWDLSARAEKAVPFRWVRRLAKRDVTAAQQYLDEVQAQIDKCRAELIPQQTAREPEPTTEPEAADQEAASAA
ncbi:hypothetical protein ACWDBD_36625 [Streptomyces sp. NPDC001118]